MNARGIWALFLVIASIVVIGFIILMESSPALEINPDPYRLVQWYPPAPPPPGTYMPVPPRPRPDYYREWQQWEGRPVRPGPMPPPGGYQCGYRNVYGRVIPCR